MTNSPPSPSPPYNSFFMHQTIFLTGATGGLGGCIIHKLINCLPTLKVYALVRSITAAKSTWDETLPGFDILGNRRIVLVVGDISKPNFGIESEMMAKIARETTIVINTAANTSFTSPLLSTIKENCLPPLHLAELASTRFSLLKTFVHISTAYVSAHLPDGPIPEEIHPLYTSFNTTSNPETELEQLLNPNGISTNDAIASKFALLFPWPYAYAKSLTERLLAQRFPPSSSFPLLIIRPSIISSSVNSPYPLYGPPKAVALEQYIRLFTLSPGTGILHPAAGHTSGDANILDEVPVDWVANLTLLHAFAGTRGVVHATAGIWIPGTFDQKMLALMDNRECANGGKGVVWRRKEHGEEECYLGRLYGIHARDWRFETGKSEGFKGLEGPLSVDVGGVDVRAYDRGRREKILRGVRAAKSEIKEKVEKRKQGSARL